MIPLEHVSIEKTKRMFFLTITSKSSFLELLWTDKVILVKNRQITIWLLI